MPDSARARGLPPLRWQPLLPDPATVPWFVGLSNLTDGLDNAAFRRRLRAAAERLRAVATEFPDSGSAEHPALDSAALVATI